MVQLELESRFGMIEKLCPTDERWLDRGVELLKADGVFILERVLDRALCELLTQASLKAQHQILCEVGLQRLEAAGEDGIVRFPLKYQPEFSALLEAPLVNVLVSNYLSPTAICHLMNAILLKPANESTEVTAPRFQSTFHRDFPRFTGEVPLSVNSFYCLGDFNDSNGSTRFIVGSHRSASPTVDALEWSSSSVEAVAGSVIFFDSTIWHAGGVNTTSTIRAGVNVQWTHHWIKQQIDLVRYIGDDQCREFSPLIRQRLGCDARVVTSLQEYYVPREQRMYKGGQG